MRTIIEKNKLNRKKIVKIIPALILISLIVSMILILVYFDDHTLETIAIVIITFSLSEGSKYYWELYQNKRELKRKRKEKIYELLNKMDNLVFHLKEIWDYIVGDFITIERYDNFYKLLEENMSLYKLYLPANCFEELSELYKKMTFFYVFNVSSGDDLGEQAKETLREIHKQAEKLTKRLYELIYSI
ncbi:MAG: hypothetical protein ACTSRR_12885 [Candidatus Heimdallarchaeaceae archaeon]